MRQIQLNYRTLDPAAYKALLALESYIQTLKLDAPLLELVKVRASQINGCAYCTDVHSADALKAGVPQRQLLALTVWHESPVLFNAAERAVLRLTEVVTLLPQGVSDEVISEMKQHYSEAEIVHWMMAIIAINAWNRVGVTAGMSPT